MDFWLLSSFFFQFMLSFNAASLKLLFIRFKAKNPIFDFNFYY